MPRKSGANHVIQFLRNIRLTAGTVSEHLTEAPFVLILQVLRKLPAGIVRPLARLISAMAPSSGRPLFLLASHAAGQHTELIRRFESVLAAGVEGEPARK